MKFLPICLAASAILFAACNQPPETAAAPAEPQGREETRTIRNTEAIGYSGDAIANKVDSALDTNDQRKEQLDKEMEAQQ